ncbi:hypothetical protein Krac_11855 [Ktedonobacter racemifer DSM 44963]|uniref:Uncharacterized protein n=1 Tax=Ktedonobacter racemifer DSM 44963 TaxID=485913 RepID=D6TDW0_KTERA|nr:hypothetical protein Krac_11855 [Ktedonobacter racemifer DSM 44963]
MAKLAGSIASLQTRTMNEMRIFVSRDPVNRIPTNKNDILHLYCMLGRAAKHTIQMLFL